MVGAGGGWPGSRRANGGLQWRQGGRWGRHENRENNNQVSRRQPVLRFRPPSAAPFSRPPISSPRPSSPPHRLPRSEREPPVAGAQEGVLHRALPHPAGRQGVLRCAAAPCYAIPCHAVLHCCMLACAGPLAPPGSECRPAGLSAFLLYPLGTPTCRLPFATLVAPTNFLLPWQWCPWCAPRTGHDLLL